MYFIAVFESLAKVEKVVVKFASFNTFATF